MTTSANYTQAKEVARKVLRDCGIVAPPVSPREIAEAYGIQIKYVVLDKHKEVAGFFDFGEQTIYVNNDDPYNRKTFTIAHELGHHFLHRNLFAAHPERYKFLLRRPMGAANDPLEQEANVFAAELLVPKELLDKYSPYATQQELANLFAVSQDVIRYRSAHYKQTA